MPHSAQNRALANKTEPQFVHLSTTVPQDGQKRESEPRALPHCRQVIVAIVAGDGAGFTPAAPHVWQNTAFPDREPCPLGQISPLCEAPPISGSTNSSARMRSTSASAAAIWACISTSLGAGTNEDAIIVAKADDILLWEDSIAPTELRFEEVGGDTLQVKLVVYGYSAFTAGRYPTAICKVTGTGLVTPTF